MAKYVINMFSLFMDDVCLLTLFMASLVRSQFYFYYLSYFSLWCLFLCFIRETPLFIFFVVIKTPSCNFF